MLANMRAIIVFLLFIVFAYINGALFAYPLKLALDPVFQLEYKKYLQYATLISGLLISGVYLHYYGLLSFQGFGFSGKRKTFFAQLINGMVYGIGVMLVIEIVLFVLGIHVFNDRRGYTLDEFLLRLIKAVSLALLISLVEESSFRGGLFSGLLKKTNAWLAMLLSSALYASVHFIRYREAPPDTDINWLTGFIMMPEIFRRFYEWSIMDYFLTLFMLGLLLGLLRLRHGTIAACIGVHAGLVTVVKLADYYAVRTTESGYDFLVSPYNPTFGWISFSVILLFTLFYLVKLKKIA